MPLFRFSKDSTSRFLATCCATSAGGILLLIVFFLCLESIPALENIGLTRFFTDHSWHPEVESHEGLFSLWGMIFGSFAVCLLALCVAGPLGIGSAICISLFAPAPLARIARRMFEILSGIPSVIFGLWGLLSIAPALQSLGIPGQSMLTGGFVLGLMILPTVVVMSEDAIRAVSSSTRLNALALGLDKHATALLVILPLARRGLRIALLLGLTRAIGETMVVVMLCGNIARLPNGITAPVRTLTANIALEMAYAFGDHRAALFVTGLVLMAIVLLTLTLMHRNNLETQVCPQ